MSLVGGGTTPVASELVSGPVDLDLVALEEPAPVFPWDDTASHCLGIEKEVPN